VVTRVAGILAAGASLEREAEMDRFKNIVVGVDLAGREHLVSGRGLSRFSRAALEKAVWVARRNGAHLHLLATIDVDAHAESLILRAQAAGRPSVLDTARDRLEDLATPARGADLVVTTDVQIGLPADALMQDVLDNDRDLVVVGTRERGALARRLMGSTALRMVVRSPCAAWIAREGPNYVFDTVLAPVDFDDVSGEVLKLAESFARDVGATLHVLHAVDYSAEQVLRAGDADEEMIAEYHRERRGTAQAEFDALLTQHLREPGKAQRHLVAGGASQTILETASRLDADLVVMGTLGRHELEHRLLGDTAERVLPHLDTSLLVVKPPRNA
jgi:CPA2 family monovalent cation:H+ antiporter-2